MNEGRGCRGMKARTIKMVLRRKVDAWLETIKNEDLREQCRKEAIVTGGCIASMMLGEDVNDFDVYFRNVKTVKRVASYYLSEFVASRSPQGGVPVEMYVDELTDTFGDERVRIVVKSAGVSGRGQDKDYEYFESRPDHEAGEYAIEAFDSLVDTLGDVAAEERVVDDFAPVFLSSNAISLKGKIQLILRFYGDPDTIHSSYDFAHCMNYWESGSGMLSLNPGSLEALLSKTLVYKGSKYPICSVIRARKFIERGWRINAGQYLKMAMQISALNLTNHEVLEEQLTGVDVAYFSQVVSLIKDKNPEKVDETYLVEIIDRMF